MTFHQTPKRYRENKKPKLIQCISIAEFMQQTLLNKQNKMLVVRNELKKDLWKTQITNCFQRIALDL